MLMIKPANVLQHTEAALLKTSVTEVADKEESVRVSMKNAIISPTQDFLCKLMKQHTIEITCNTFNQNYY